MPYGRSLEHHLKYFGLVEDGGKAIAFSEWATLAQDGAGWPKLVTKAPFNIGKSQLRPPRCDTRVTPEEKRRFLARRAQKTEQRRRALCNAETDAETTQVRFQNYFMNSFHFRGRGGSIMLPVLYTLSSLRF
jgi:hypothetical protein